MNDDQKWLEAAAAIEQDIVYLKAAMADAKRNGILLGLGQEILQLNVVLDVYRMNAASGVVFPHPDVLFCISNPHGVTETAKVERRNQKASGFYAQNLKSFFKEQEALNAASTERFSRAR